jgi:TRAP-type C4-dicarboxylate transport system substrate-binding protein
MAAFAEMDADPTPMAFGELFTALQQGTIDAEENPFTVIYSSKFFEVQKYLTITNHLYSPTALLISLDFYETLPEELKAVVAEAAVEAAAYERQMCDEQEARLLDELVAEGMLVNTPDIEPFVTATKGVYDSYVGEGPGLVDPAVLERVYEIMAEYSKQ